MSSPDNNWQELGPIERSHLKEMVQRNALESAAYVKLTKHLEHQKKAFVRQNTRDEGEMKNLLSRLQMEQQTVSSDAEVGKDVMSEIGDVIRDSRSLEPEPVSNPYPITITPRFGATPCVKQQSVVRNVYSRLGASVGSFRRKSVEYEDVQESLNTMAISNLYSASDAIAKGSSNSSTKLSHDEQLQRDWLASPDAISSVRRMRRSDISLTQPRTRRLSISEQHSEQFVSHSSCPPSVSHSRSNSLKDKKSSSKDHDTSSPKLGMKKRGNSLKERKTSLDHTAKMSSSRSSSISSVSLSEYRKTLRKSPTKDLETDAEAHRMIRKNSRSGDKPPIKRQTNQDSTPSVDCDSPRRPQGTRHVTVEIFSGQTSLSSPTREGEHFKF